MYFRSIQSSHETFISCCFSRTSKVVPYKTVRNWINSLQRYTMDFLNNICYTISHYKNDWLLPLVNYQLHRRGDEEMGRGYHFSVLNCEPTGHLSPLWTKSKELQSPRVLLGTQFPVIGASYLPFPLVWGFSRHWIQFYTGDISLSNDTDSSSM